MRVCVCVCVLLLMLFFKFVHQSSKKLIKVACVGDSITFGGGGRESYPHYLQQCLGERFEVGNFGLNGATMIDEGDRYSVE